jgi:hypothetical protein
MYSTELIGVDGGNLLGYLAALGTLRVLTIGCSSADVRMEWVHQGTWRPVLHHSGVASEEELLGELDRLVCGDATVDPAWRIGDDLNLTAVEFGKIMCAASEESDRRRRSTVDFLASFGGDVYASGPKKETMSDTAFRTMSGAGHQHFLGSMRELAATTEREHLRRALLAEWEYADGRPSLRWDAADYRPHALRAKDPSTDPIRTMRGANRLAVEALPLFPVVPSARRLRTTGFDQTGAQVEWPIWTDRLELRSVASLVAARMETLRPGVAQVYRAARFTEGKYRNFSPAKALF